MIAGEELRRPRSPRVDRPLAAGERRRPLPPGDRSRRRSRRRHCAATIPTAGDASAVASEPQSLHRVADELAAARGDLMGAMLAEGGKTLTESDPEVSEAIDFCRFYADTAEYFHELAGPRRRGKGVVVVVSPWNFPLAIPCGGVAAALAAGNTVILKPASDTVLIAYQLCQCFWRRRRAADGAAIRPLQRRHGRPAARLPRRRRRRDPHRRHGDRRSKCSHHKPTMQPARRNRRQERHDRHRALPTATWRSRTSCTRRSATAGRSARPRRCSSSKSEVYDDAKFRATLCDAVESLPRRFGVGPADERWARSFARRRGELERALKELEPGEEWAVMPRLHVDDNPHLVSPGVKWGVQPGSVTHCTEFFGPVLGVMEAREPATRRSTW